MFYSKAFTSGAGSSLCYRQTLNKKETGQKYDDEDDGDDSPVALDDVVEIFVMSRVG